MGIDFLVLTGICDKYTNRVIKIKFILGNSYGTQGYLK